MHPRIAATDVNGDGAQDLVLCFPCTHGLSKTDCTSPIEWYKGSRGAVTVLFTDKAQFPAEVRCRSGVTFIDIDGDGEDELITVESSSNGVIPVYWTMVRGASPQFTRATAAQRRAAFGSVILPGELQHVVPVAGDVDKDGQGRV